MELTEVSVTRIIAASAESIFDLWMDSSRPGSPWFGAERLILNPVVDGLFYLAVQHNGRSWPHFGRFVRIDRPSRIEYTWVSEATQGHEALVTITLDPQGNQTEVTLRHSGVPNDEMGRQHKDGWSWVLSMVAERFNADAPQRR